MEKIKIFFEAADTDLLENKVNNFLMKTKCKLISAHYSTLINEHGWGNSVLIVYLPQEVIYPQVKEQENAA